MKKDDFTLLIGLLMQELGGEVNISAKKQAEFMSGFTKKELLYKQDPKTNEISIKLVNKEEVKELIEEN